MTDETNSRNDPSDGALLAGAAGGDKLAFAKLYDRLSRPLYSLAMKILGDPEEAQDLLQEVFTHLWTHAKTYDARRAKLFTWAVTLTRNKAIDRLRLRQRRARILDRSVADIAESSLSIARADTHQALSTEERRRLVRKALASLGDDQRASLELAFFEGLTQSEIAERLNQPLGTIKARIRRSLLQLRDALKGLV